MAEYKARIVDALLERKLKGKGAVLVEGAKWCEKTEFMWFLSAA